jgi:UDP-N-acetylmuramoyl-tripeptide--D-alanyl-D-alanine ligase
MTIEALYNIYLNHPTVQTDTRKLKNGDLFFALKGANFNGNAFAAKALEQGAAYCIVDEDTGSDDTRIIKVDDVLMTLQLLAGFHRKQFNIPFIGITGSNGKTTTKELVHAVLSRAYRTYTTEGNLNNHIGIPLTLLKVKKDAEMAVVEMGANHQKEIEGYCKYAFPSHGMITNIGKAHLEGFGGIEGVKKGKGELFDHLRANNGTAFICRDYEYFESMSKNLPHIVWYGSSNADITGHIVSAEPFLKIKVHDEEIGTINSQLVGAYNFPNIMAAVAIGKYFKVPGIKIREAIEAYAPGNSRSQMITKGNRKIVLDAYNANPTSMKAAIENFAALEGDKKVLILGGMMELGEESITEHKSIIDLIAKYQWYKVILVGGDYKKIPHPYINLDNSTEAKSYFKDADMDNSLILVKGSRSTFMEKVLEE